MERFAADPTASVPKACQGWGETMAAYRFFDNDSIDWQAIMAPHWEQTAKRMAALPVVLCLQVVTVEISCRREAILSSAQLQTSAIEDPRYQSKQSVPLNILGFRLHRPLLITRVPPGSVLS